MAITLISLINILQRQIDLTLYWSPHENIQKHNFKMKVIKSGFIDNSDKADKVARQPRDGK